MITNTTNLIIFNDNSNTSITITDNFKKRDAAERRYAKNSPYRDADFTIESINNISKQVYGGLVLTKDAKGLYCYQDWDEDDCTCRIHNMFDVRDVSLVAWIANVLPAVSQLLESLMS